MSQKRWRGTRARRAARIAPCACSCLRSATLPVWQPAGEHALTSRTPQGDEDDIEALERDISEESGWKLVHGDVFRPPHHLPVLLRPGRHGRAARPAGAEHHPHHHRRYGLSR